MKIKMNRLVTLFMMAVMSMSICTSCVKHVDADAETLSGKEAENDTGSKIDLFEDVNTSTNDESGNRAFVTGPYGKLSLKVPETWSYEIANVDDEKLLTGCYGIILKPNGIDNGQIEVVCADNFAVCGTGLTNEKNTLAGASVRVGTYDADAHWSFIVFEGENPQVVVNHTDCTSWSDSTWNEAWSILDTISFDRNQTEGGIGQFDPESENADIGVIMTVKNVTPKGLTVHFWQYENKAAGELDYGEEFSLEKKDGDTWVLVPQVIDDAGFTLLAYMIPPGGETEINVNWEWIYGRLEPGTYRINKSVIDHRSDGNTIYTLKAQFVLAESKEQNDPDLKWVKECYFQYLTENDLIHDIYAPQSADDLSIEKYVGVFGNGCVVAYMSGDGLSYIEAERTEVYGNNKITFRDGQICYAFYQNKVYTIGQAYELGILNNEDILRIDSIVGSPISM